jgi:hypothetical protein
VNQRLTLHILVLNREMINGAQSDPYEVHVILGLSENGPKLKEQSIN